MAHSFDAYGRPLAEGDEEEGARATISEIQEPWNFDDSETLIETPPEVPSRPPDTSLFPSATQIPAKSPPRSTHRRKSSGSGGISRGRGADASTSVKTENSPFKVRFALRGHTDVVRSVIFTGGGSPSEPEICTTGDDGTIKRWIIPANYGSQPTSQDDLDIQSYFTHRGHEGAVTSLAACPAYASFSTGGRSSGDGWIFSGGQDATVRVWERGQVDAKATLEGHTDAVWAVCVLPATAASVFGSDVASSGAGSGERILLATGSADHTIKIWAVSAPPQLSSPSTASRGNRRGVGGSRRHSVTSGSNFPNSPQPSTTSSTPFHHTLMHSIEWPTGAASSPTCISALGPSGKTFVVSYSDSSIIIFDTRTGEEMIGMASSETYDGSAATAINSVVVTSMVGEGSGTHSLGIEGGRASSDEDGVVHGATGSAKDGGIEGVIISGHEDKFVRFFDANSGQCTYSMLAHPASIASLSLSPDGRELVSAGHDASLRFWSLEKRSCVQEINAHRLMRGEGVCSVVWSQDARYVVSGGGDGVVKVFAR